MANEPGLIIGTDRPVFRLIDRQITGQSWATVSEHNAARASHRIAMYSLKGGVGRSTTTAVAAWHLARLGRSVLVLDLDLESPGLSASLLPTSSQPEFGIVDWFVEDAIGQGDAVIAHMSARAPMAQDLPGDVWVVPSHGADPGDFMAKLGRCYLDLPGHAGVEAWDRRLLRLLSVLEADKAPDVVLLDARSGFHDLASAVVTELADTVLLFAIHSEQTWSGYRLLFEHWQRYGVAERIRERLQIVAALIPETDRDAYLSEFRERSWGIFRDHLYDELGAGEVDGFSFDLNDAPAPHRPLPIYWHRGIASLGSLTALDPQLVAATAGGFLAGLDELLSSAEGAAP
ncbi:P-loop NTPase [uncultured Thiocystis sp.]|uniref:ParA family protein n=1 Tax=uncultured Thiocystis sp. TaxID=1202134 RepID=UPI0025EE3130|nr:P-loop NTPase [uncultured Thiocystis sp.]